MKKILLLALMLVAANLNATDWLQFRGPNGSGIAAGATVPTTWSDTKNLQWKTALPGRGSSSPIVYGERVFVTGYSGYGDGSADGSQAKLQRHLVCLDRSTGKILWDKAVPAELPEDPYAGYLTEHGYASSTPVTDGQRVYVFFGKTGALAFDFTGKQVWKVNVGKQSSNRRWGSGASLLLYKNLVIVNAAEESRSIRALDTLTGKEVWKSESDSLEFCFSTPALVDCGGDRTDLVVPVPGELWALNPDTGKLRWFAQTQISGNASPSVVASDGVIFVTGGFPGLGTTAVRGGGKGDVTKTHVLWSSEVASYVPSPVVQDGYLYFVSDKAVATCMEAKTGKVVYKEPLPGITSAGRGGKPVYAATLLVNGNLYAVTRRKGTFALKAATQFAVIAQNNFTGDDSDFNATPAISGNQIFLRSNRYLYCVTTDAGG
jgi:outer membrane protein assembly factor BamB